MHRGLFSAGAMDALAPTVFKIRLLSTRNFLTFYYCQADVSTCNEKIIHENNDVKLLGHCI